MVHLIKMDFLRVGLKADSRADPMVHLIWMDFQKAGLKETQKAD